MDKIKWTEWQTTIYNTLHRKLKAGNTNPLKTGSELEGLAVPAPRGTPVVLLIYNTNIIWYGIGVEHLYT